MLSIRNSFAVCVVPLWLIVLLLTPPPGVAGEVVTLRSGPMVGYGEMTEVMLWVQTTAPATVQYRFWPEGKKSSFRMSHAQKVTEETDCITHTLLSKLEPGMRFEYEVLVNGAVQRRPFTLRFQTQPLWQWRTDPPDFTIAIGSCAYVNDSLYDRPGKPYGGNYEIFTSIASKKPDVMLWLGDNVYYREVDWTSASTMRYRNSHTRALPEMQPLIGAAHNYAIWDDHDFGPNNSDRTFPLRREALDIFKLFWANHTYGLKETPGVFSRFQWGDVEFFLLDDRYHRAPNDVPDGASKEMFGGAQLQWLQESLVSSAAPFKIVVGGNQMLNLLSPHEAFARYPREHAALLQWIRDCRIPGVLFLSGDRHHTELIRLEDSTFYPLYDYTSSPLTSSTGVSEPERNNPLRVPGTWVNDVRNFGLLKFDGSRKDRRLTMECYNKDGVLLWSHTVRARDLVPPDKK